MVKRLLELFCGTKSVGNVFKQDGYEVVSLDYNAEFNATHTENILTWDYQQYPPDHFDVIWASPDCTTWSLASGGKYRKKDSIYGLNNEYQEKATLGNNMVLKVIEIINYFNPPVWYIENPRGLLKSFPPLIDFIKETNSNVSLMYYGNYNDWGFMKPTDIWSNMPLWKETKPVMDPSKYTLRFHKYNNCDKRIYTAFSNSNARERSKIPPDLIHRLKQLIPQN